LAEGKLPPQYWFQLGLYTLIVSRQPNKNWVGSMALIDSLDKNNQGHFPVLKQTYSQDDYNLLTALLEEGNRKLKSLEFLEGCGNKDCQWCQFAKNSGQASMEIPREEDFL
jgi:DNA helicase-2/ATP-dependent DNA helicase PcrA